MLRQRHDFCFSDMHTIIQFFFIRCKMNHLKISVNEFINVLSNFYPLLLFENRIKITLAPLTRNFNLVENTFMSE